MNEWISVDERLPELPNGNWVSKTVIACIEGKYVHPMIFERAFVRKKTVERWKYCWDTISDEKVTHWMPLPEPPELPQH